MCLFLFCELCEGAVIRSCVQLTSVHSKAMVGASKTQHVKLSKRVCILEIDLYEATPEQLPKNRTLWTSAEFQLPPHRDIAMP